MNFSYHPKYEAIAKDVWRFLNKTIGLSDQTNFIVGGDGSLFTYADFNAPNFLISSHKYSRGYYSACFFEDNYKQAILDYLSNPKEYEKGFQTVEVIVNGTSLPERAINEIRIERDGSFKAMLNCSRVSDTGLLVYTPSGCSAWAGKYGGAAYDSLGWVLMDERQPHELNSSLEIKVLKYHKMEILVDGKGRNLDEYYNHASSKKREQVYTKPWILNENDSVIIRPGKQVRIVKMEIFK